MVAHAAGPVLSQDLRPAVAREWRMLIGGELTGAIGGQLNNSIDPARETVLGHFPDGTAADVDRAVNAAKSASGEWRRTPMGRRAEFVLEMAAAVDRHGEELAILDSLDNGSPIRVMRGDFKFASDHMRYFAGLALQLRGETIPTPRWRSLDFTLLDPFGVVGRIVPFNHPLMFAASKIAAPLIAGNTVVLKPSVETSLSALRMGELFADIVPPGVLNVVTGSGARVGEALVRHPEVRRLAFTGSAEVGLQILRSASDVCVKNVTLELGGKNPCIVFADTDHAAAIDGALRGMNFTWQGQSCGSTSRLYVHRSIFADFIEELGAAMDAMKVGDPMDEASDVGAIVSRRQYDKVCSYIQLGLSAKGARLVAGGAPRKETPGLYIRPTLFAVETEEGSPLEREEIFGPVLVAVPFDTYDEVIARANSLPLGLTASVWTTDLSTAMNAASDLQTGYVWVNSTSVHVPGAPFGGQKDSGIGREESLEELYSFTQTKNVFVQFA